MEAHTDANFACYRTDFRPQPQTSLEDSWIYPDYTAPRTAFPLPSLYPHQRTMPDQNYPSPSPSVPSPGPRPSQLDISSSAQQLPADAFGSRDSSLGPVRSLRSRQLPMDYKLSRRSSVHDPQVR